MSEFKDTACIVYPSQWPVDQLEAHCTIAFLGEIATANFTLNDVKNVVDQFMWPTLTIAATGGLDWFGPEKNIPVVRLLGEHLHLNYEYLYNGLEAEGITVDISHGAYKPHITVNPFDVLDPAGLGDALDAGQSYSQYLEENIDIPDTVGLGKPEIWWGNEHYS